MLTLPDDPSASVPPGGSDPDDADANAGWVTRVQPAVHTLLVGLDGYDDAERFTVYGAMLSLQRAALHDLTLSMSSSMLEQLWQAACLFPQLRTLRLATDLPTHPDDDEFQLGNRALGGLPASLAELHITGGGRVHIAGEGLLRGLTSLHLRDAGPLEVDAALPSLLSLEAVSLPEARLQGARLQLPALTQLQLVDIDAGEVAWEQMPALEVLLVYMTSLSTRDLSLLTRLSSLELSLWGASCREIANELLQTAAPSLRSLMLFIEPDAPAGWAAAVLGHAVQLTRLEIHGPSETISDILPLQRLRELHMLAVSANALTIEGLEVLAALPHLQLLRFGESMPESEDKRRRIQLLKHVLPGCLVEEGR